MFANFELKDLVYIVLDCCLKFTLSKLLISESFDKDAAFLQKNNSSQNDVAKNQKVQWKLQNLQSEPVKPYLHPNNFP